VVRFFDDSVLVSRRYSRIILYEQNDIVNCDIMILNEPLWLVHQLGYMVDELLIEPGVVDFNVCIENF